MNTYSRDVNPSSSFWTSDKIIGPDDLQWWYAVAPTLTWTFAKTYAQKAPHSYVVLNRTPGLSREDFVRAARVIRTFGQPAKFYSMTNIYLTSPDGAVKWWTMDRDVCDTDLINMTESQTVYGTQNAPVTETGAFTPYDSIASAYDQMNMSKSYAHDNSHLHTLVTHQLGDKPPRTLDIGCGTGRLLDADVTTPVYYTALDPSRGMLNELVRKHPRVSTVIPCTAEEAISQGRITGPFDLVAAIGGSASYLSDAVFDALVGLLAPGGMLMLMPHELPLPSYFATRCFGDVAVRYKAELEAVIGTGGVATADRDWLVNALRS